MILPMRSLFAVPWLSASRRTLFSVLVALILVFSIFGLLKNSGGGKPAPTMALMSSAMLLRSALDIPRGPKTPMRLSTPRNGKPTSATVGMSGVIPTRCGWSPPDRCYNVPVKKHGLRTGGTNEGAVQWRRSYKPSS
jgi:hypothetical protein